MPCHNPTSQGFRALRNEPAVLLAEIAWRWIFGVCAAAFVSWAFLVFLNLVEVSRANLFLLETLNPDAMSYALRNIFSGKGPTLLRLLMVAGPCLSALWVATAAIGRIVTTRVLLERSARLHEMPFLGRVHSSPVIWLQILRVLIMWLGVVAYIACAFLAFFLAGGTGKFNPGVFLLSFLFLFAACIAVLGFLHWWFGLAPIFALRDGLGTFSSLGRAASLIRSHPGQLTGLNLWHVLLRVTWLIAISVAGAVPFGLLNFLPGRGLVMLLALVTVLYFAGADLLFVARYAGYIEIAEQERMHSIATLARRAGTSVR